MLKKKNRVNHSISIVSELDAHVVDLNNKMITESIGFIQGNCKICNTQNKLVRLYNHNCSKIAWLCEDCKAEISK